MTRDGRSKIITSCLNCGGEYSPYYSSAGKYCSNACQQEFQFRQAVEWAIANDGWPRGEGNRKSIRKVMLHLRGNTCELCGLSEWTGQPIPVVIDHINGDPYDNRLDNLRVICCNCDALLPTHKARNRGNGRHYRRQRYAEGKSH